MADQNDVPSPSEFRVGDVFETEPSEMLRAAFLEYVRETGEPESFPGLCTSPVSGDEAYSIVAEFVVDRKRRPNLDEIPCAICSPRTGKFLDGRFVWYPSEKKIRIIGHECANAHLNSIAQEEYERKQFHRANDNFLLENFFRVPAMLAAVDELLELAEEYQRVSRAFYIQAPLVQRLLRKLARDNDGLLSVDIVAEDGATEKIGPAGFRSSQGSAIGHTETVGTLRGLTALLADYEPASEFAEVRKLLEPYAHDSDTAGLDTLAKMDGDEKAQCVAHIRSAEACFLKAEERLSSFSDFFTQSNFDALRQWVEHPQNTTPMRAEATNDVYVISGAGRSAFKVHFTRRPPESSRWPKLKEPFD